jgi:uncharacterized phiE125 gp8 family phage protein
MDITRTSPALTHSDKLKVVPLEELKLHARIIDDDENALLGGYIEAAFDYLHGPLGWLNGYCILEEEFSYYLPSTLKDGVEIPVRPLIEVTGFEYLTSDGTTYDDVDVTRYRQLTYGAHGVIARATLPYPYYGTFNHRAYRITFRAGHEAASEVPSPIRQAIKMLAAHYYSNREVTGVEKTGPLAYGLQSLAGRYRVSPDHS